MLILGLNLGHDGTAALVENGRLVGAISNERLSRVKKASGVTQDMVEYVLQMAGKRLADVTIVAISTYNYYPENSYVRLWDKDTKQQICHNVWDLPPAQNAGLYLVTLGEDCTKKAVFIQHHLAHCAAAYYTSPFDQAACFSVDSSLQRPEACSLFAYGKGKTLHIFHCPGIMIGNAYFEFTRLLGLGEGLFKAGTTMGLAAYGKVRDIAKKKWKYYGKSYYARRFQDWDRHFINLMWSEIAKRSPSNPFPFETPPSQATMDIAASIQYIFTRTMVQFAQKLYDQTEGFNSGNLCLSGGSFLNCDANAAIWKETPFQNVHLFPGCGDDGTAVGAALYVAHTMYKEPRYTYLPSEVCYLGRHYDTPDLGLPLDVEKVASSIASGKIVAWYQGQSEFGPRALGNRSLLADPRRAEMRDIINHRVKHREWFRPFAPSVLAEHTHLWFDWHNASPYMLYTAQVLQPERIPSVTHVDGSARMQTVEQDLNPTYHALISAFFRQTGVPLVLNTSLNGHNEPLVETPNDAINFFQKADQIVELLVINDRMITRDAIS